MSGYERTSVSLLILVAIVAVLVKTQACNGGPSNSPPPTEGMQTVIGTVVVTGDSVNLRQAPARSASVVAQAERGQELDLLAAQEDWYNVRWGEGSVWLSKLYASPAEDCPTDQPATAEALRRGLPAEWKGEIRGRPATFVFYTRGERLCAYVLYDDVKEALAVEESSPGALTLVGKRYERLGGTTGEFWLDTFSGRFEDASGRLRLAGTYADARNSRGEWFAERPGSASETADIVSTDEDEPQLAVLQPEPTVDDTESPSPPADQADAPPAPAPADNESAAEQDEEQNAATPEDGAEGTESDFLGRWEGEGRQFDSRQQWRLQMNIASESLGSVVGSIRYPSLRCGGELVLIKVHQGIWTMRENITYGSNCVTGGSITMEPTFSNRARWLWYFPRGELGAQAEVRKRN
jgi:hypothetical protein